jgi:hypothetical protein
VTVEAQLRKLFKLSWVAFCDVYRGFLLLFKYTEQNLAIFSDQVFGFGISHLFDNCIIGLPS